MLRLLIRVPSSVTIKVTKQGTRLGERGRCGAHRQALRGPEAGRVALPGPFLFFSFPSLPTQQTKGLIRFFSFFFSFEDVRS